jgi:hypothetical protein
MQVSFCFYVSFFLIRLNFLDRFYWSTFDPINLSEAFFSIGIIFAFVRICFFLPAFESIGPLQITLGKMIFVCF